MMIDEKLPQTSDCKNELLSINGFNKKNLPLNIRGGLKIPLGP